MNSPAEIARLYEDAGTSKTKMPFLKMFVLAVLAGMFIALGAFGSAVVSYGVQPAAVSRLLSAVVFPIGLMLVLVAGAELFTGNCLIIIPVMQRRASVKGMLYNWIVVYLGNFAGSLVIAFVVSYTLAGGEHALYGGELLKAMVGTASAKTSLGFADAFFRGILCNFMVCLAVWVSFAATDLMGKIAALYLPVFLFVLCGFEHCVANMYFIPAGIIAAKISGADAQNLSVASFLVKNMIPVTLGNIVGGSGLVGLGYWFVYLQGNKER